MAVVAMTLNKTCKLKHQHRTFLLEWQEDSILIGKMVNTFASSAMLHHWKMRQEPFDVMVTPITECFLSSMQLLELRRARYSSVQLLQIRKSERLKIVL